MGTEPEIVTTTDTDSSRKDPANTPKEVLAAAVSEALNDTKERLLTVWRRLPLWFHLVVIAIAAACTVAWRYEGFVVQHWQVIWMLPRVSFGDPKRLVLTEESSQIVRDAIATLEREGLSDLAASTRYPPKVGYEAFSAAQTIVSMRKPVPAVLTAIAQQKSGNCWSQYRDMPPNLVATAWVLRAYALARQNPGEPEVRFLLDRQREGAWPVYDGTTEHSTFATAITLLALYDLIQAKVLPADLAAEGEVSLNRGIAFLRASNAGNRWRYYPGRSDSNLSDADTGLAIYTLHYVGAGDARLDKLWLDSLPHENLSSRDDEISNARWLYRDELQPPLPDTLRHLRLPWVIAGTVSAYANGTSWQKAKASVRLNEILSGSEGSSFLPPENFRRSQLLIALRHLSQHSR